MAKKEWVLEPRDVVQAAIDAYHDHDLDQCRGYYAPDVVVKDADGNLLMDGAEAVRTRYAKSMSDNPHLHYDIPNRIALGEWVIDGEVSSRASPAGAGSGAAAFVARSRSELRTSYSAACCPT